MIVMKFGGTSIGSGERILQVARIVLAQHERDPVVVTSAMSGVTDVLLAIVEAAGRGDRHASEQKLAALENRHIEAANIILPGLAETIQAAIAQLRQQVDGAIDQRDTSPRASDAIVSWGERLAVLLVVSAITVASQGKAFAWHQDDPIIVTDDHFGEATPDWEATGLEARWLFESAIGILVTPGFLGYTFVGPVREKCLTTLGRGGSDYSATILAAALGAEACWIYTDVDGVFTADPRIVPEARVLPVVTVPVAGRLAMCGAKVLHPRSVAPAARHGIELRVRNTFRPEHEGTHIILEDPALAGRPVAVAGRKKLSALALVGQGLSEIPNLFGRVIAAVTEAGVEVVFSAHPVPGHTPEILVDSAQAASAMTRLEAAFASERRLGQITSMQRRDLLALCALVGDDLSAATLPQAQRALASAHVPIISQSANADALCFILPEGTLDRAIRALHREVIAPAHLDAEREAPRPYPDGQWAAGGRPQQRRRITSPQH